MNKTALILQHTTEERGGLFEEVLLERGWGLEVLPLFAGADLPPSLNGFGLTLVMGGPMSANQERAYPFLKKEIPFLRKALKTEEPVLGICLERLHSQARRVLLGFLHLLETKRKSFH